MDEQLAVVALSSVEPDRPRSRYAPANRADALPAPKCAQCHVPMRTEYRPLGAGRRFKLYRCSICRLADGMSP
jgi:hypothetical protein